VLNKRVHGYEKWTLQTLGNQIVAAKVTHVSMEVDSYRPTQYKFSVDTNKQQTFSMDIARLYKQPCREEQIHSSFILESSSVLRDS
jgi:hypothetical protein